MCSDSKHGILSAGWKGEESVKDRIVLEEPQVVPFLEASYTLDQALADLDKKVRRWAGHLERRPGCML